MAGTTDVEIIESVELIYLHQGHRKLMSPDMEIILRFTAREFKFQVANVCLRVLTSC